MPCTTSYTAVVSPTRANNPGPVRRLYGLHKRIVSAIRADYPGLQVAPHLSRNVSFLIPLSHWHIIWLTFFEALLSNGKNLSPNLSYLFYRRVLLITNRAGRASQESICLDIDSSAACLICYQQAYACDVQGQKACSNVPSPVLNDPHILYIVDSTRRSCMLVGQSAPFFRRGWSSWQSNCMCAWHPPGTRGVSYMCCSWGTTRLHVCMLHVGLQCVAHYQISTYIILIEYLQV